MSTAKGHYTNPTVDDDELIDPDDGTAAAHTHYTHPFFFMKNGGCLKKKTCEIANTMAGS